MRKRSRTAIAASCVAALSMVTACSETDSPPSQTSDAGDTASDPDGGTPVDAGATAQFSSPDWSQQIIYFLMLDRFANGDPSNDDQGQGEYDPTSNAHFNGGDLQGVIDRLDYIQGLGATAVWITPPVANQWWDPVVSFGGYHGYWARNHKAVDEHFGDLQTYKALADALHERGMYLIQDIVPNHVGNFFYYEDENAYDPNDVTAGFRLNQATVPTTRPEQSPFDQNDVNNPDHRAAAIYHWTPSVRDFNIQEQEFNYQLSNLDDVNTENPVVVEALKDSFTYWIEEVGVDGFRVDTAKFIPHEFWREFIHGEDGVNAVAARTGRMDFLSFGEVFELSAPFERTGEIKATSFLGTPTAPELGAVIQFPLHGEIDEVFGLGAPTAQMTYRLNTFMTDFPNPYTTPTFIDNHDMDRFISKGNPQALQQAIAFLMTIPGIPMIYYGTEQLFSEAREAMFGGGFNAPEEDRFDDQSEMYAFIRAVSDLRKANPSFRQGTVTLIGDNASGPGLFAYRRRVNGDDVLVVFNTADEPILVSDLDTGLAAGAELEVLLSGPTIGGQAPSLIPAVREDGRAFIELPSRGFLVARPNGNVEPVPNPAATIVVTTDVSGQTFSDDIVLTGTVTPASTSLVVVTDALVERGAPIAVNADGTWTATVSIDRFPIGRSPHTVQIYAPDAAVASPAQAFETDVVFDGVVVAVPDPLDDDHGPTGDYQYPAADGTFGRELDIESVTVEAGGASMRVRMLMRQMKYIWLQSNGFDHVSFTLFFDVPGQTGLTVLPQLDATAPNDFQWNFMNVVSLDESTMHVTTNADADNRGDTRPAAAPDIDTDLPRRTVTFTYDRNELGIGSWDGVKVYVLTWDIDGITNRYRPLAPDGSDPWAFVGPAGGPKIMDDVDPITIPAQ